MHKPRAKTPIDDEENLARVLFSPTYVHNDIISPDAFRWYVLNNTTEDYLSVLRCGTKEEIDLQSKDFKPRNEGDKRYGYTTLIAGDVRKLSQLKFGEEQYHCTVEPRPSRKHPNHAGIIIKCGKNMITGKTQQDAPFVDFIRRRLVKLCSSVQPFKMNPDNTSIIETVSYPLDSHPKKMQRERLRSATIAL